MQSRSSGALFSAAALVAAFVWTTSARAQDGGVADDAGVSLPVPAGEVDAGIEEDTVTPEELEALQRAIDEESQERNRLPSPGGSAAQGQGGATAATDDASRSPSIAGFSLQSMNPDIAFIADIALAYFTVDEPLQTGGHDPTTTGFTLQQLEMSISKSVDPYFRFDSNIVFSLFGVEIEEAYVTTLALPHRLQLRLGQFLTRFGRLNNTHPHAWQFVDQPFALGRVFGGEANRGLGTEVSWLAPTPWFVEVIGSVTGAQGAATARSFFGGEDLKIISPLDFQYTGAVKQFFPLSDDLSLLWGLSAATGPNASGYRNRSNVFGTDLFLKYRPISDPGNPTVISLQAEVFYRRRQVPDDLLSDFNGYAELFWRFDPRWGTAGRYEFGSPAKGQGGIVTDPLDPEWLLPRHRASANVTFWPTEFSRARLQAGVDLPRWREEPIWSLMLAFEFAVGAHGAHTF